MHKTSLVVDSKSQDISIQTELIKGTTDGLRSSLHIFVEFTVRRPYKATSIDLVTIDASLRLYNPGQLLSRIIVAASIHGVNEEWKQGAWLEFVLDEAALNAIEKHRTDDIRFNLELILSFWIVSPNYPNGGFQNGATGAIQITIPRSVWVEKILSQLGYRSFRLVEIPLHHESLLEAYDDIISEFNKAEKYFKHPDYNKCVAHCRHALDKLTRNLKKIKEISDTETGFKWLKAIDESTLEWIDKMDKACSGITSKANHGGQKRDFTRAEAESIYLVTVGLLNYIGNIAK
jgi:hypothetical protein